MPSELIVTDKAPKGSTYAQARKAGGFIFVAAEGPVDPKTGQVPGPTLAEQVPQTIENIRQILLAAGADLGDVVKVNVYLASTDDFKEFSRIYGEIFKPPYPARTTIQQGRPWGNRLLEMDAIAYFGVRQTKD